MLEMRVAGQYTRQGTIYVVEYTDVLANYRERDCLNSKRERNIESLHIAQMG